MEKVLKLFWNFFFFFFFFFSVNRRDKSYMLTIQTVLGVGMYKNNVKIAKRIWKHMFFMHASIFVISVITSRRIRVLLSYLHSVIPFVHYKVKLLFSFFMAK